jgi:hypothetical protein
MAAIAPAPELALIDAAPPRVLFAELVAEALDRTGVVPTAHACAYLVDLLADAVASLPVPVGADGTDESFAEGLLAARLAGRRERAARLRALGDRALYRSGFFADSLAVSRANSSWVREAGRMAYGQVACLLGGAAWQRARLFEELADCFGDFAEVLTEVGDGARAASPEGLVALSGRYLREGRGSDRRRLARRGLVVPPQAVGRVQ